MYQAGDPIRTYRRSAMGVAAVMTAGFGILFGLFQAHNTTSALIENGTRASVAASQMETELLRAERATVGFVLSTTVNTPTSSIWLKMRSDSIERVHVLLTELDAELSTVDHQRARLRALKDLVAERIGVLNRYSDVPPENKRPLRTSPQRGFEVSNQIREIVGSILDTERGYIERRARLVWLTYVGFLVVLLVVVVSYIAFARSIYTKLVVDFATEKGLRVELQMLLRELHHRVKNSLQTVSSVLRLQEIRAQDNGAIMALAAAQTRVAAIARVHQSLYELQKMELPALDYVTKLLDEIEQLASMRIMRCLEPVTLSLDAAVPLSLILNELVTNAVKYGGRKPVINIALHPHETIPDHFVLRVSDNGTGFPDGFNPNRARSLGYSIIKALTIQLAATDVTYTNEPGATFYMVAPNTQHGG